MTLQKEFEVSALEAMHGGPVMDELERLRDDGWALKPFKNLDRPWLDMVVATKEVPDFAPHPTDEAY